MVEDGGIKCGHAVPKPFDGSRGMNGTDVPWPSGFGVPRIDDTSFLAAMTTTRGTAQHKPLFNVT